MNNNVSNIVFGLVFDQILKLIKIMNDEKKVAFHVFHGFFFFLSSFHQNIFKRIVDPWVTSGQKLKCLKNVEEFLSQDRNTIESHDCHIWVTDT